MSSQKIPTLDTKLDGQATYLEWIISIEDYLDLIPVPGTTYRIWDAVTGNYAEPAATGPAEELRKWKDANIIALITIKKNCESDVRARIGTMTKAKAAYEELKKAFGKTTTEFHALLRSLNSIEFDDRKTTIKEHITLYERTWNSFVGVISRADLTDDDGFGAGLQNFAKSDKAKTHFLLESLPPFYANTIKNIRAKDHGYHDTVRKLKECDSRAERKKN